MRLLVVGKAGPGTWNRQNPHWQRECRASGERSPVSPGLSRLAALHTWHVLAQRVQTQGPLSPRLALAMTFL